MFDLNDCMAFTTCRCGKDCADALERRLCYCEVNRNQWIAMHWIYTNRQLTQCDLAGRMSITEPSVARMLQKLDEMGYLQKHSDAGDKRKNLISLSDKGEDVYRKILPIVEKFKADTVSGISESDLQTLKATLEKMVKNAREQ